LDEEVYARDDASVQAADGLSWTSKTRSAVVQICLPRYSDDERRDDLNAKAVRDLVRVFRKPAKFLPTINEITTDCWRSLQRTDYPCGSVGSAALQALTASLGKTGLVCSQSPRYFHFAKDILSTVATVLLYISALHLCR
jgi:hypothetical protein